MSPGEQPVGWETLTPTEVLAVLRDRSDSSNQQSASGFLDTHQWMSLTDTTGINFNGGFDEAQFKRVSLDGLEPPVSCFTFNPVELPANARSARGARTLLARHLPVSAVGDLIAGNHLAVVVLPEYEGQLVELGGTRTSEWSPPMIKAQKLSAAANRLDAVISGLFRVPRSEARTAISSGFIIRNLQIATKRTSPVSTGDRIVYRTLGRAIIDDLAKNPRSNRYWVSARLYPV